MPRKEKVMFVEILVRMLFLDFSTGYRLAMQELELEARSCWREYVVIGCSTGIVVPLIEWIVSY